jgi:hypothetical protein
MSTPLTDRIAALTARANSKTGASDTTLTDAVGRLIDGYKNGIDVTITDVPFTNVTGLATYLFDKISGENMKAYMAVLTNPVNPNQHQQVAYMIFENQNNGMNAGGLRIRNDSSGISYYFATSTNLAVVTVGDIYTVYTL